MKKKSLILIISVIFLILAVVTVFFVLKDSIGNPTLDVPEVNNTSAAEDSITATVTFPEGLTVTQIAKMLEENKVCSAKDFINEVNNPSDEILSKLSVTNNEERIFLLEGYVFPDTYEFYKGEAPASVLGRFIDNFNSKITEKDKARAAELGYSIDEILAIASIIQKEAGREDQDYKVSSVIHNRLNSGTRIECDVTVNYLEEYCKPYLADGLTEEQKSNYNTYSCPALPKGPICNPGYTAIQAALYPEQTDYMFFVTDEDMNYYYAVTWAEHCANCSTAGIPGY